jgi:hypothetical protein
VTTELDRTSSAASTHDADVVDAHVPSPEPADGEDHSTPPVWRRAGLIGGTVALGAGAIALVDPRDSGVPVCWSQGVFGIDCPLCGGLRCVNSLARGDLAAAADHNVVLAVALPVVAVAWAVWMVSALRGRPLRFPTVPRWLWTIAAVAVVAFTVVRNLDLGPVALYLAAERG